MEAVIIVPVFIISVLMLITIIPIMAGCENVTFSVCDELHGESVKSGFPPESCRFARGSAEQSQVGEQQNGFVSHSVLPVSVRGRGY